MSSNKLFTFNYDELEGKAIAHDDEQLQMKKEEIQLTAGRLVRNIRDLAEHGDIESLKQLERGTAPVDTVPKTQFDQVNAQLSEANRANRAKDEEIESLKTRVKQLETSVEDKQKELTRSQRKQRDTRDDKQDEPAQPTPAPSAADKSSQDNPVVNWFKRTFPDKGSK